MKNYLRIWIFPAVFVFYILSGPVSVTSFHTQLNWSHTVFIIYYFSRCEHPSSSLLIGAGAEISHILLKGNLLVTLRQQSKWIVPPCHAHPQCCQCESSHYLPLVRWNSIWRAKKMANKISNASDCWREIQWIHLYSVVVCKFRHKLKQCNNVHKEAYERW